MLGTCEVMRHRNEPHAHAGCGTKKRSDLIGIRTQDPQLRRLLLYPTELSGPSPHEGSCTLSFERIKLREGKTFLLDNS